MVPDGERLDLDEADREPSDWASWLSEQSLELPVVVKPTDGGSSQNVAICRDLDSLASAARDVVEGARNSPSSAILIETWVEGREYTAGFFEETFLGGLEVVPGEEFYDYEAKYESDATDYRIVEDPSLLQRLEAAGHLARRALGAEGVLRADFVIETEGDPVLYVLEVNTIPGMTETSLVPKLAAEQGIDFEDFAELMLSAATCRSGFASNRD
jgi:D-alanine-D-alanine ligase